MYFSSAPLGHGRPNVGAAMQGIQRRGPHPARGRPHLPGLVRHLLRRSGDVTRPHRGARRGQARPVVRLPGRVGPGRRAGRQRFPADRRLGPQRFAHHDDRRLEHRAARRCSPRRRSTRPTRRTRIRRSSTRTTRPSRSGVLAIAQLAPRATSPVRRAGSVAIVNEQNGLDTDPRSRLPHRAERLGGRRAPSSPSSTATASATSWWQVSTAACTCSRSSFRGLPAELTGFPFHTDLPGRGLNPKLTSEPSVSRLPERTRLRSGRRHRSDNRARDHRRDELAVGDVNGDGKPGDRGDDLARHRLRRRVRRHDAGLAGPSASRSCRRLRVLDPTSRARRRRPRRAWTRATSIGPRGLTRARCSSTSTTTARCSRSCRRRSTGTWSTCGSSTARRCQVAGVLVHGAHANGTTASMSTPLSRLQRRRRRSSTPSRARTKRRGRAARGLAFLVDGRGMKARWA